MLVPSHRSQVESSANFSACRLRGKMIQRSGHTQAIMNLFFLHPPSPLLHLHSQVLYAAGKAGENHNPLYCLYTILQTAAEVPAAESPPLVDAERRTDGLFTCQVPFPARRAREKQPLLSLSKWSWDDLEATERE